MVGHQCSTFHRYLLTESGSTILTYPRRIYSSRFVGTHIPPCPISTLTHAGSFASLTISSCADLNNIVHYMKFICVLHWEYVIFG